MVGFVAGDSLDELAGGGFTRLDGHGLEEILAGVHGEGAFVLAGGVAFGAAQLDEGRHGVGKVNGGRLGGTILRSGRAGGPAKNDGKDAKGWV